jgi:alpha-tubulin suppressor-like RCC1 family protein
MASRLPPATPTRARCAVRGDGSVWCWGNSSSGQLGTTKTADQLVPIAVGGLGVATAVAASGDHTCARLADATAWCWGDNANGELGTAGPDSAVPPPGPPGHHEPIDIRPAFGNAWLT